MSRSQFILVLCTLILTAIVLHVSLCEWAWKAPLHGRVQLLAYQHEQTDFRYSGVFSQRPLRGEARDVVWILVVVCGVVLPVALVASAGYLALGWPARWRQKQGRCPDCGYDLRGVADPTRKECPECGWRMRT